jgi:hypothetical protein
MNPERCGCGQFEYDIPEEIKDNISVSVAGLVNKIRTLDFPKMKQKVGHSPR